MSFKLEEHLIANKHNRRIKDGVLQIRRYNYCENNHFWEDASYLETKEEINFQKFILLKRRLSKSVANIAPRKLL